MTKNDLIEKLSNDFNFATKYQLKQIVDSVFATLTTEIQDGKKITINGFGTFQMVDSPERNGRNPATGAAMVIPAHKRLKFKASSVFKEEAFSMA